MQKEAHVATRLLLIDTCGDPAGVALAEGERVCVTETLARQRASAEIVAAIARLLTSAGWRLAELQGIGVVHGPGSFTGLRTGLSVAKGLSEATGLPVFAVSRLAVLAQSCKEGFVALDAGRGEVYVRDVRDGRESLMSDAALLELAEGNRVRIAEEGLLARLATLRPTLIALEVGLTLLPVLAQLPGGGVDLVTLDAHYLREESGIYTQAKA